MWVLEKKKKHGGSTRQRVAPAVRWVRSGTNHYLVPRVQYREDIYIYISRERWNYPFETAYAVKNNDD